MSNTAPHKPLYCTRLKARRHEQTIVIGSLVNTLAKTMRAYALTRATNHGLLLNTAHTPPVVATPVLHATNDR